MAEDTAVTPAPQWSGSFDAFHRSGIRVKLPILPGYDYAAAFACVTSAVEAGWLVTAPGLEDGEEKESIGWVLRGAFEKEGESTPYVLLYAANEALTWSILKVYLNRREDVDAFEFASGMKLDSIPDYIGDNKPQRGAAPKTDRFIVRAPKPFGVVFKKNPRHDDTEAGKMKPARLFVRWEHRKPDVAAQNGKQRSLPETVDYYCTKANAAGAISGALTNYVLKKLGGNAHDWKEDRRAEVMTAIREFAAHERERKSQAAVNTQQSEGDEVPY